MKTIQLEKYLPLTEATTYILLSLTEPLHGYGVMQKVEQVSEGTVTIGPGTLYTAFSNLEKEKLIEKIGEENRRKIYQLSEKGQIVVREHLRRTEIMIKFGLEMEKKF